MARQFTGLDNLFVRLPATLTYPLTFAAWYSPSTSTANLDIVGIFSASNPSTQSLYIYHDGTAQGTGLAANGTITTSPTADNLGFWNHIAGVFVSPTSRILYQNGVQVATGTVQASVLANDLTGLFIGSGQHNLGSANNWVAHVGIWNTQLTAAQIQELFTGAYPPTVSPGNLVDYVPVFGYSPEPDLKRGLGLAVTGSTVVPNVTIFAGARARTVNKTTHIPGIVLGSAALKGNGTALGSVAFGLLATQTNLTGVGVPIINIAEKALASAAAPGAGALLASNVHIRAADHASLGGGGTETTGVVVRAISQEHPAGVGTILVNAGKVGQQVQVGTALLAAQGFVNATFAIRLPVEVSAEADGSSALSVTTDIIGAVSPSRSVEYYLNLITSEHNQRPLYMGMLQILLQPLADIQALLSAMPVHFDLDKAIGVQLDIDGQWIGRSRQLETPIQAYFSWDTPGLGWDEGYWKQQFDPDEGIFILPDEPYRTLLRAVAAANEWNGTVADAYRIWAYLGFDVLIQDTGLMSMTLALHGPVPDSITKALLTGPYIQLRPAGVEIDAFVTETVADAPFFGFDVQNNEVAGWDTGAWGLYNEPAKPPFDFVIAFDAPHMAGGGKLIVHEIAIPSPRLNLAGGGTLLVAEQQRAITGPLTLPGVANMKAMAPFSYMAGSGQLFTNMNLIIGGH